MKVSSLFILSAVFGLITMAPAARAALLLRYTFDDGTATDSGTGTAANGTPIGSNSTFTSNTPGGSGQAYSTGAGSNDYLTTGTTGSPDAGPPAKLTALNAFTLTLWVNLQAAPAVSDRLLSTWDTTLSNGIDFRFNSASATSFTLTTVVDNVSVNTSTNVTAPGTNTWLFLAFTYDGSTASANAKVYSGGVLTSTTQVGTTLSINAGAVSTTGTAFQVGGTGASTSDRSPSAFFDDVRVYDTVLDQTALDAVRLENVPEPASLGLAGLSLAGLLLRRRRD